MKDIFNGFNSSKQYEEVLEEVNDLIGNITDTIDVYADGDELKVIADGNTYHVYSEGVHFVELQDNYMDENACFVMQELNDRGRKLWENIYYNEED